MKINVFIMGVVGVMTLCPLPVLASMQADEENNVIEKKHEHEHDIFKTVGLDEVVVSANKNTVKRKDAPIVVNVISARLLEQVNAPDLAKSLSYLS